MKTSIQVNEQELEEVVIILYMLKTRQVSYYIHKSFSKPCYVTSVVRYLNSMLNRDGTKRWNMFLPLPHIVLLLQIHFIYTPQKFFLYKREQHS
jgi:hypothetical protein